MQPWRKVSRNNPAHIYATGDVTGRYQFTHMGEHMKQGCRHKRTLALPKALDEAKNAGRAMDLWRRILRISQATDREKNGIAPTDGAENHPGDWFSPYEQSKFEAEKLVIVYIDRTLFRECPGS